MKEFYNGAFRQRQKEKLALKKKLKKKGIGKEKDEIGSEESSLEGTSEGHKEETFINEKESSPGVGDSKSEKPSETGFPVHKIGNEEPSSTMEQSEVAS